MVKKLYSADSPDDLSEDKKEPLIGEDIDRSDKNDNMMRVLSKRSVFSYKYWREACMRRMMSWYCCCFKSALQRRDRLFKDARSKLYEEIDILEIIKKLRVNKFTSEIVLKPR